MASPALSKAWILGEVGDSDDGTLAAIQPLTGQRLLDDLWDRYADKSGELQVLYVKRAAIDALLAVYRQQVSFKSPDLGVSQAELTANLRALREETQHEIVRLESLAAASRAPAIGQLATVAPVAPPYGPPPNANYRKYRGDPYYRSGRLP